MVFISSNMNKMEVYKIEGYVNKVAYVNEALANDFCNRVEKFRSNWDIPNKCFYTKVIGKLLTGDKIMIDGVVYKLDVTTEREYYRDLALRKLSNNELKALDVVLTEQERKDRFGQK